VSYCDVSVFFLWVHLLSVVFVGLIDCVLYCVFFCCFFFVKQKTAYEIHR